MSSHHFVKEQQEPALIILNTEGIAQKNVAPLLEWVPTILVGQDEIYQVLSWGIKVDFILAEMDFQKANYHLLEEQYPVKFLGVRNGEFLEEAIQYLIATKHGAANIIGFDHGKVFDLEPKLEFIDLVTWDGPMRYFPVKNKKIRKWYPKTSLQLHAPEGTLIEFKNEDAAQILSIAYATMVDVQEGYVELSSNQLFWVGELVNDK